MPEKHLHPGKLLLWLLLATALWGLGIAFVLPSL